MNPAGRPGYGLPSIQHDLRRKMQAMGRAASLRVQGPTGARVRAHAGGNAGVAAGGGGQGS